MRDCVLWGGDHVSADLPLSVHFEMLVEAKCNPFFSFFFLDPNRARKLPFLIGSHLRFDLRN